MTEHGISCVHPNPQFRADGSRWCDDCARELTDAEGYDVSWLDVFTGSENAEVAA